MFYIIYKVTNRINGKIYIGKHKTNDLNDGYMGSGKLITRAIKKHGIDNFTKEILFQFDNEADMNSKEAELVTEELCSREDTYNLCSGGQGGWSYVNKHEKNKKWTSLGGKNARKIADITLMKKYNVSNPSQIEHVKEKLSNNVRKKIKENNWYIPTFSGKSHTEEHKQYMSEIMKEKQKGENNSQYGTMWITNGSENKKIKKVDIIPEGWYKGRIAKIF